MSEAVTPAATPAATPVVLLHVWRVPARAVPPALGRLAVDRFRLRREEDVRFGKLLGTGTGYGFGPTDAELTRYAALTVHADDAAARRFAAGPVVAGWDRLARAGARLTLRTISSRGRWSGREPFPTRDGKEHDGPVLALTRARLRPARAVTFWRAVPPVAAALRGAPGLLARFGVGEAPIGWQGTVSVWRTTAELVDFAYRQPQHRAAIARTATVGWYAEELFARFAVSEVTGDRSVLDWREEGP
ncbi:MAG TPA: monooxygenase [Micromonosporaceae bacterium]|nr:monooxygenase [Micromonosporaceae bacterium]